MITKSTIIAFLLTFSNILYSQSIEEAFYTPQKAEFPDSILIRLKYLNEDKFVTDDFTFKDININIKILNYLPSTSCDLIFQKVRNVDTCVKYFDTCLCIYHGDDIINNLERGFHRYLNNKEFDLYKEIEKYLPECQKLRADMLKEWYADSIRGIYIPQNVEDAVEILLEILPKERLQEIKEKDESEIIGIEHLNLGHFIRNYWNFWGGSRLKSYFQKYYPIYHPESISSCMILFLHRKLNNKDLEIDSTIKYYSQIDNKESSE